MEGLKRKLKSRFDSNDVEFILNLIPSGLIFPLYFKGDIVWNKDIQSNVEITKFSWKNGGYIYYFLHEDDEVYSYEESFELKK